MFRYSDLDTLICINDGYNIKIILNDCLLNENKVIFTDTLYACDKKFNRLRIKPDEIKYIR